MADAKHQAPGRTDATPAFPSAMPPRMVGAAAWYGPDTEARHDEIEALSDAELGELAHTRKASMPEHADLSRLALEEFELSVLATRQRHR